MSVAFESRSTIAAAIARNFSSRSPTSFRSEFCSSAIQLSSRRVRVRVRDQDVAAVRLSADDASTFPGRFLVADDSCSSTRIRMPSRQIAKSVAGCWDGRA